MEFIKIKYSDEKTIIEMLYSIADFITFTSKGAIFIHNSKEYILSEKNIYMDEEKKILFLKMELKK